MENLYQKQDDPSISDSERLLRGIPPNIEYSATNPQPLIFFHHKENRIIPSSLAFQESSDKSGMSVYLESVLKETNRTPEDILDKYAGVISLIVLKVRELEL